MFTPNIRVPALPVKHLNRLKRCLHYISCLQLHANFCYSFITCVVLWAKPLNLEAKVAGLISSTARLLQGDCIQFNVQCIFGLFACYIVGKYVVVSQCEQKFINGSY